MKKRKLAMSLAFMVALGMESAAFAATDNPFASIPLDNWSYSTVDTLVQDGLIDGYTAGDFRKDRPLTRYEMAVFAAKAMSNISKANDADKEQILSLENEFKDELGDMHVRVGTTPVIHSSDIAKAAEPKKPDAVTWSGEARLRYDHKTDSNNKKGDCTGTGVKDTSYYYELTGQTHLGSGWNALVRFLGARDGDGQDRGGQENTNGQFDMSRLYVKGPLGSGTLQVGRDKAGEINSMVMNEYYTGLSYSFGNKAKVNVTYGKPDYNSSTRDTTNTTWTDDRGINKSDLNPGNFGINYFQIDAAYPLTDKTTLYGAFYHTMGNDRHLSNNKEYEDTNIGEIAFDQKLTKDLTFGADYAKSSRSTENTGYNFGFDYHIADKNIPHSWAVSLDYIHLEKASYIKSSFDIKDNNYGRKGWQLIYKYVPTKNVLWTTRWLQSEDLTGADKTSEKWLRTQIEYFF